jgi:hypothetical protein
MRTLALSAFALGALASTAVAGPIELTKAQMDAVRAAGPGAFTVGGVVTPSGQRHERCTGGGTCTIVLLGEESQPGAGVGGGVVTPSGRQQAHCGGVSTCSLNIAPP